MIYLDNAATTWPKPEGVLSAIQRVMTNFGSNPGRGNHQGSIGTGKVVYHVRELLAQLFGVKDPNSIVFTQNATHALNQGIWGLLKSGDHVITTSMEHNSVWRPLKYLERTGVSVEVIQCNHAGQLEPRKITAAIRSNTKLIVTTHASNVTGTILPIAQIGEIAREQGIFYMVDASQSAGTLPINVQEMGIDLLAFPGHKGLYGPQGTGGLYVGPNVTLQPLLQGGTGSHSELELLPDMLPDRLESGTLNAVGIAGLGAGVEYILDKGIDSIHKQEMDLCQHLVEGLSKIPGIILYGPENWNERTAVLSINLERINANEVGYILDRVFGIAVRTGLHCAPQAHRTIGTLNQGTIRFSPAMFNSHEDIENTILAMQQITKELLQ